MTSSTSAQENSTAEPLEVFERSVPLAVAALASLAAGAIHATAIGAHGALPEAVQVFTVAAAFQIGWGAITLLRPRRYLIGVGILGHLALLGGWLLSKTVGIGFVDGLDHETSAAIADSLAAGLAVSVVAAAIASVVRPRLALNRAGPVLASAGLIAVVLGITGMGAASSPDHHGSPAEADHHGAPGPTGEEAGPAAVARPYDPELPIDLGGIEGVTPQQQARAENLVAATLSHLPKYADPDDAEAAGFRSIGDGATGYEHFMNPAYRNDGEVLNPYAPESLVYETDFSGERRLVAAMYMAEPGTTLDTVPELGGPLTQWHVHRDLCFTREPESRVTVEDLDGNCPPPFERREAVPMIHVWITPHPCGPFAALEGIAGGQIPEGETRLCDTAHGSH